MKTTNKMSRAEILAYQTGGDANLMKQARGVPAAVVAAAQTTKMSSPTRDNDATPPQPEKLASSPPSVQTGIGFHAGFLKPGERDHVNFRQLTRLDD